jgi:hypothetical protein
MHATPPIRSALAAVALGDLPAHCRRTVLRCAGKSTCGRPGAVVCRRTTASGRVECSVIAPLSVALSPLTTGTPEDTDAAVSSAPARRTPAHSDGPTQAPSGRRARA